MKKTIAILVIVLTNLAIAKSDIFEIYQTNDYKNLSDFVTSENVNNLNKDGYPLIFFAIYSGKYDQVKELLEIGADPNIQANDGLLSPLILICATEKLNEINTNLYYTLYKEYLEEEKNGTNTIYINSLSDNENKFTYEIFSKTRMIPLLISYGAKVDKLNAEGIAPLHFAANTNFFPFVERLLTSGADVNILDKEGHTPLDLTTDETVISLLKNNGGLNAKDLNFELINATINSDINAIKIYLNEGGDINQVDSEGNNALMVACMFGDIKTAGFLIEKGINMNYQSSIGNTAIKSIIGRNYDIKIKKKLLKLLHEAGEEINPSDARKAPFIRVIETNDFEAGDFLIELGCDLNKLINTKDITLNYLNYTVIIGLPSAFDYLIKKKLDLEIKLISSSNVSEMTALNLACDMDQREEYAKKLIVAGADVNTKNSDGTTPLIFAAKNNRIEIVDMLIKNKARLNLGNKTGQTPLMQAALYGQYEPVKALIEAGADVNRLCSKKMNALNYAMLSQPVRDSLVMLLIDSGIEADKKDISGFTPAIRASAEGNENIIDALIRNKISFKDTTENGYTAAAYVNDTLLTKRIYKEQIKQFTISCIFLEDSLRQRIKSEVFENENIELSKLKAINNKMQEAFYTERKYLTKALENNADSFSSSVDSLLIFSYSQLLEKDPDNTDYLYRRGNAYFGLAKYDSAEIDLTRIIKLAPQHLDALSLLAKLYEKTEQYDNAIDMNKKLIDIDAGVSYRCYSIGKIYRKMKQYDKALEYLRQAQSDSVDFYNAINLEGGVLCDMKKYGEAIPVFEKLNLIHSDWKYGWNNIGFAYYSQGKYKEAINAFLKAYAIQNTDAYTLKYLSRIYCKMKLYDEAIIYLQKWEQSSPDDVVIKLVLLGAAKSVGKLLLAQDNYIESLDSLLKDYAKNPEKILTLELLVELFIINEEYDKASAFLKESKELTNLSDANLFTLIFYEIVINMATGENYKALEKEFWEYAKKDYDGSAWTWVQFENMMDYADISMKEKTLLSKMIDAFKK